MLVLTRKPGEQIIVADNIRITVVSVGNGRVKIGIEAPRGVRIDRQEIHERKQNEEAAEATPVVVDGPTPAADPAPSGWHNRIADRLPPDAPQTPLTTAGRAGYRTKPR